MPEDRRISFFDLATMSAEERARLLLRTEADLGEFLDAVRPIIDAVRAEGDAALVRYARELDRAEITSDGLRARDEDFARAYEELAPEVIEAIDYAVANIRAVHEAQRPEEMWLKEVRPGAFAGDRYRPIPTVACYVPRGKGAFPSVTMMATVPAVVAGVPRVLVITPPGPGGSFDAATLVACDKAGVREVYKCGGAQGIAAVAFGTETVPKVDKVVGPGSPYVVAAKRLLADRIDTGLPAGPSEAIVLADRSANGRIAGLDLIIESEHGPDSSALLVTDSREVAEAAIAAIPGYWKQMGTQRAEYSAAVLCGPRGGVVLAPDMDAACAFVNDYAPEHLEILAKEPMAWLGRIDNAAEILLGPHTPFVLGNFVIGVNCVLPTGGWAKTWSPLSVFDFLKRSSIAHVTPQAYPELARHARVLAAYEGFDGHANAIAEATRAAAFGDR